LCRHSDPLLYSLVLDRSLDRGRASSLVVFCCHPLPSLPHKGGALSPRRSVRRPGCLPYTLIGDTDRRRPVGFAPPPHDGFALLAGATRMRMPCYEHTIHRFAAPRNIPWRRIPADGRRPRVVLRHALLLPALLPMGDESRMNSWRTFLEIRQGEFPWDSSTTP